jgi:hypothetical protein
MNAPRTTTRVLKALLLVSGSSLGTAGCLPPFSFDPTDGGESDHPGTSDGGSSADGSVRTDAGARDSGERDAHVPSLPSDAGPLVEHDGGTEPPLAGCNVSGKYLVTERFHMEGLGAQQTAWNWYYVELAQSGGQLTYKRSLSCGARVEGVRPPLDVDDSSAWPAYTLHPAYEGRKGTVEKTVDGCLVMIDEDAIVRGATVDAYRDTTVPLPNTAQQATASSPGWEDWDDDGQPGVTLHVTGFVSGELYAATRHTTAYSGVVQGGASLLTLELDWKQDRTTFGYSSQLLTADAAPDPSADQTVQFGKLTDEQAEGDDLTICQAVRALAPTLTPVASKL